MSTEKVTHTQGDIHAGPSMEGAPFWCLLNNRGNIIAMRVTGEANAARLALTWNSHDVLVEALRKAVERQGFSNDELIDARAALALTKNGE